MGKAYKLRQNFPIALGQRLLQGGCPQSQSVCDAEPERARSSQRSLQKRFPGGAAQLHAECAHLAGAAVAEEPPTIAMAASSLDRAE